MKIFFKVVIWIAALFSVFLSGTCFPTFDRWCRRYWPQPSLVTCCRSSLKSPSSVSCRTNSWSFAAVWNCWIARLLQSCAMLSSSAAFDDGWRR